MSSLENKLVNFHGYKISKNEYEALISLDKVRKDKPSRPTLINPTVG